MLYHPITGLAQLTLHKSIFVVDDTGQKPVRYVKLRLCYLLFIKFESNPSAFYTHVRLECFIVHFQSSNSIKTCSIWDLEHFDGDIVFHSILLCGIMSPPLCRLRVWMAMLIDRDFIRGGMENSLALNYWSKPIRLRCFTFDVHLLKFSSLTMSPLRKIGTSFYNLKSIYKLTMMRVKYHEGNVCLFTSLGSTF